MSEKQIRKGTIRDLKFDPKNANRGTARGNSALEESIQRYGIGRSVLADKNGVIIAGNKTVEKAGEIGIENVVMVPTRGDQLVVVVREDLDLSTDPEARALAIADNRVGELDLNWDANALLGSVNELGNLEPFFSSDEIDELMASVGKTDLEPDENQLDQKEGTDTPIVLLSFKFDREEFDNRQEDINKVIEILGINPIIKEIGGDA